MALVGVTSEACQLDIGNVDSTLGNWARLPEFIPELEQPQKSIFLSPVTDSKPGLKRTSFLLCTIFPEVQQLIMLQTSGFSQDHKKHLTKEKQRKKMSSFDLISLCFTVFQF